MQAEPTLGDSIGIVVIGRNEGERLRRCLRSIDVPAAQVIYVDSGSTDDSVSFAASSGVRVVALDPAVPFTAARARNEGWHVLLASTKPPLHVQFVDGDCAFVPGWLAAADAYLRAHPGVAVVCGRRRERDPGSSVYNRLCDAEWNTPVGEAKACGGDAMMRTPSLEQVGGFCGDLIAGEEPELCVRLRAAGWKVWRLEREMTLHDAAMTRFGQWWARAKRGGYAFAEGARLHGKPPERHWVRELRRAWLWGAVLPALIAGVVVVAGPMALWALALYPLQVARLAVRHQGSWRFRLEQAVFLVLGKFAEAAGAAAYEWRRLTGRAARLIEYK